jgi:hypothetical protein
MVNLRSKPQIGHIFPNNRRSLPTQAQLYPATSGGNSHFSVGILSYKECEEYSIKETYPPGKLFYYEQILQVPNYGIFDPASGSLEFYRLSDTKQYRLESPNQQGQFWIPEMQLFLGAWQGTRENRQGYWLRWWDERGNLLPWGTERVEAERQRAEAERQRAEAERQRAERLAAQLRAAGLEPEE